MQDKKFKDKQDAQNSQRRKKGQAYIEKLLSKISPSNEDASRARLQKFVSGAGSVMLSWILSAGIFFFGSQPFALALLCSTEQNLIPVFIGIFLAVIGGRAGAPLLWGGLAIFIFRIIISFVPDFHDKKRDEIKATTINLEGFFDEGETPLLEGDVNDKKGFREKAFLPAKSFAERLFCIYSNTEEKDKPATETKKSRYNETLAAKALFAGIGGFVCGLFALIENEYAFYNMLGALCLIILTPVITVIFSGADNENVIFRGWRHTLSWLIILSLAVWSGGGATLLGIPVTPFIVMLFTLFITSVRGVASGVLCGVIFGLIYSPLYAPLLVLCSLIYGIISPLKKSIALGTLCIGVVLWCYYFGGTAGLVGTLTPMLIAVPVFFVAEKYYITIFPERAKEGEDEIGKMFERRARQSAGVYFAEAVSEREKNEGMTDKLGALSEAFSSLSKTFNDLVDRFRRPDILGLKKISEESFEHNCEGCRNRDVCWGVGYTDTLDVIGKMTSCLHTRGEVEMDDLPESFLSSCPRAQRIVKEVNSGCEMATESIIHNQKIGAFASNFDDIGAILRDALEGEGEEYECDLEAGERVFELLTAAGYKIKGVVVCGKRNRRVLIKGGASQSTASFSGGELCKKISEIVGVTLMGPIFEMSAEETVMTFYSKPRLSAVCSHGRLAAESDTDSLYADILKSDGITFFRDESGEEVSACGDCTRVFVNGNSYFYSLISDGMGSGADAALASEVSSMFVEKMLMAGNRADITVRMLNNFLRSENIGLGRECSATLDLFELDLMNGSASFIKSGAAPTFICRDKAVYKVNSRTMPVGIIKQADAKLTRFDTRPGDVVVMVSDGCCPDSEECPWLVDYLSGISIPREQSPEALEHFTGEVKNKILTLAVENTPEDRHKDDVSVSVVLISA